MKRSIIWQLIVTILILAVFFTTLSSKGDIRVSLLFTAAIAAGFAGAALLGILACYVIGAAAAIFVCSVFVDPVITAPLALVSTVVAVFITGRFEKQATKKSIWLPNVIQFIIVLVFIGGAIMD